MTDSTAKTYKDSHTEPGKGAKYDKNFSNRHRSYLWDQEQSILDDILARHFSNEPVSCLDFACGTGRLLAFLAERTEHATGVDVSAAMLEQAEQKLPGVELVQGDITTGDPLNGRTFGLITAFRFFPNAEDELRLSAATALGRYGEPGSLLVFNNHKNPSSATGMAMRVYCKLRGTRFRTMSLAEIDRLTKASGWEVIETHATGIVPGYEWLMPLPYSWYARIDALLGRWPFSKHIALDQIIVCKRQHN